MDAGMGLTLKKESSSGAQGGFAVAVSDGTDALHLVSNGLQVMQASERVSLAAYPFRSAAARSTADLPLLDVEARGPGTLFKGNLSVEHMMEIARFTQFGPDEWQFGLAQKSDMFFYTTRLQKYNSCIEARLI